MFDISYSRESDAIKKNEPVIDWLDANIGRVSIKISLLTTLTVNKSPCKSWTMWEYNIFFQSEVQTPEMIRLLTTVVAESVIDGIGG